MIKDCIRTRRLASIAGWAKQAIIHEFFHSLPATIF